MRGAKMSDLKSTLTIGQLAKKIGVSHDTIRLYERHGLIAEPSRAANGYREYSLRAVDEFEFIIRTKKMGFTLNEIKELLSIHHHSKTSCGEVKLRAQEKLKQATDKINELRKLEVALKELVQNCSDHKTDDICPMFELLKD